MKYAIVLYYNISVKSQSMSANMKMSLRVQCIDYIYTGMTQGQTSMTFRLKDCWVWQEESHLYDNDVLEYIIQQAFIPPKVASKLCASSEASFWSNSACCM